MKALILLLAAIAFLSSIPTELSAQNDAEIAEERLEEASSTTGTIDQNEGLVADSESLFRKSGKIYVVVGVLVIIFTGILLYLIFLDRKITKLENSSR